MSISSCPEPSVKGTAQSARTPAASTVIWQRRVGSQVETFIPTDTNIDDLVVLEPFRPVHSSKRSRNVVVAVWSVTGQCVRELESGLEHDLHRRLDFPRLSRAVVPQPFRIEDPRSGVSHIPDFLQLDVKGGVTVWDARPETKINDKTRAVFDWTAEVAAAIGWRYEVFTGMEPVERLNRMFANGYRVTTTSRGRLLRPWIVENTAKVLAAAAEPTTMETLFALDDGTGSTISTIWHLISNGDLRIDLSEQITDETPVATS